MKIFFVLCVLSVLFSVGIIEAGEPDWQLFNETDGIRLYRRDVPDMDFDAFKGETIIHARIEVIGMVLRDVLAYPEWMPSCQQTRIIEKFDEQNFIIHQLNKTPWPLKKEILSSKPVQQSIGKMERLLSP